jgi:hypothetical protein
MANASRWRQDHRYLHLPGLPLEPVRGVKTGSEPIEWGAPPRLVEPPGGARELGGYDADHGPPARHKGHRQTSDFDQLFERPRVHVVRQLADQNTLGK